MITRFENKEQRKKRAIYLKYALFSIFCILFSLKSFSQDSIPIAKDLTEERELDFQQFFFKALSEKSIGNYQKAIENLESCNQILENDVSVFFEFSKNYLLLKKTLQAKEYIQRALLKEPNNVWMLQHLVKIYIKDRNFKEAIPIQQKVVKINPKERDLLVRLYLQNREYKKAVSLMNDMEKENTLTANLKRVKNRFEKRKEKAVVKEKINTSISLIDQFKTNKSYTVLKQILEASKDNPDKLLKYSDEGIMLFPAQPFVYLVKGRVLNYQKKYKKALSTLQNGIDFVIDDEMEVNFYNEIANSYKGLGNAKEQKKYLAKSKKIKS